MDNYENYEKAIAVIIESMEIIRKVHDDAESKHDSYGELYMDSVVYETMKETDDIIEKMKEVINTFENER